MGQVCLQVQGSSSGISKYSGSSMGSIQPYLCLSSPEISSLSALHGGHFGDAYSSELPRQMWYSDLIRLITNVPWALSDRVDLLS